MGVMTGTRVRRIFGVSLVSLSMLLVSLPILLVSTAVPAGAQQWRDDPVRIIALSNRADLVSGGDVLIEVVLPTWADRSAMVVAVDGRDVTDAMAQATDGRLLGLIGGLEQGVNRISVTLPGGKGAHLDVRNHPVGGPIFSGAQVQPWTCTTEEEGLGEPLDAKCTAPPKVEFQYMAEGGSEFQPYDPASPPDDVASTTTDSGKTVPFIIRVEKGSMNRGIYGIAVLYDPSTPTPWAQDGWDHKVVTEFGGDCKARFQQTGSGVEPDAAVLGRGFAQISQGVFTLGNQCNEIVAAEALMMLRERLVELNGEIRYVVSSGCSGGSMMQLTISNSYPGLLDGITPSCTYPDQWTTWNETIDCSLMQRYWLNDPTGAALWPVEQQKAATSGHRSNSTCALWEATYDNVVVDPGNCEPNDQPWEYNAETNPEGQRCTLADYQIAVNGPRPQSEWGPVEQQIDRGFANRPLDNVGVRYGLEALQDGLITPEQFVDLNEKVGGYDIDFGHTAERMEASPLTLARHYRAGRVTQGHNLGSVAIVDAAGGIANAPMADNVEFHTAFRGYMLRDRLIASRGHDDNHVLVRGHNPAAGSPDLTTTLLDSWMSAVDADKGPGTREEKIVRNRPADATDHCYIGSARVDDQAACAAAYPYYANPRIAAGGPSTDHIMKCQLKPHSRNSNDYSALGVVFTDTQWERLQAALPKGICDYTKPGVGEQPAVTWQTYLAEDGTPIYGGQAMGPAPVSVPFGTGPVLEPADTDDACPEGMPPANEGADYDGTTHDLAIDCMIWWEIARGVTSEKDYDPFVDVNRERMASFIARLIEKSGGELPPAPAEPAFSDQASPAHAESIERLAAAGLVGGKGDGTYAPMETVSRAQMATFLVNAYEFVSAHTLVPEGDYFGDDDGTTHERNINKAAAGGFTTGRPGGVYEPEGDVQRDQMASFLARTLDLLIEEGTSEPKLG